MDTMFGILTRVPLGQEDKSAAGDKASANAWADVTGSYVGELKTSAPHVYWSPYANPLAD